MTGVGEVFALYESFKKKKKSKRQKEVVLEPEADEDVEGFFIEEDSDFHDMIINQDWDSLLNELQQYNFREFNPREYNKKKNKKVLKVARAVTWAKKKVIKPKEPEELPVSPLLGYDEHRQTPLHLAIRLLAPDRYVNRMIYCEKRAALVPDKEGQLPLHLACLHERNTQVIDKLIRANFHHMQKIDVYGKTPLWYAVVKAKERAALDSNGENNYWGIPRNSEESEWQERQEVHWEKVKFILLSYSTRRKVLCEAERDVLLECLENAAPPKVIEVVVLASQGMLQKDPTLAIAALKIFMKAHYPVKNLQVLLRHFPEENVASMEGARRILTNLYHQGCVRLPGKERTFREEIEKHALEDHYRRTIPCGEWWDKILSLLQLCGHGNNKENRKQFDNKYLLHAALSNCDCPPALVQLLMVMKPEAIKLPHPFNGSLLIHLICRDWRYNLFPHSQNLGVKLEVTEPPMEQVLKIILATDRTLLRKRHRDRLPLHDAVATSKSMVFINALLDVDRKGLRDRDPRTKLYPFQMAALPAFHKKPALWVHAKHTQEEWNGMDADERSEAVLEVKHEQELEQLTTIFCLLKECPDAATLGASLPRPIKFADTKAKGMISAHYINFLYKRGSDDVWMIQKDSLDLFTEAIDSEDMPDDLLPWWKKLKFWLRFCHEGPELPEGDQYLLHAAVGNPDTPPLVAELLITMFPHAAKTPADGATLYPLHIAAATPTYRPQPFELKILEDDNVMELLLQSYPGAGSVKSPEGLLPIDIAKAHGKTDEEIEPLIEDAVQELIDEMQKKLDERTVRSGTQASSANSARQMIVDTGVDNSESSTDISSLGASNVIAPHTSWRQKILKL